MFAQRQELATGSDRLDDSVVELVEEVFFNELILACIE